MNRRTILGLLCALAATSALPVAASADALEDITKSGVIRVAVPQDFPPFGSVGTDLQPVGYDIDMARLIAEKLGVEAKLIPVTSTNRIPYLQTNKADLVISSLGRNAQREKVIDFSKPYAPFYNGVFGPANIKVEKAEDLAGKTVGVTRGSVEDLALTKIIPEGVDVKRYEDNNGTISAFLSGQVQLIATGNVVAAAIMAEDPKVKPEPKFLITNSPCSIGLRKNEPALLAKINEIIDTARKDGSLDKISQKWLGMPLPKEF